VVMEKPARRNRSMVAFSRLPLGIPRLSFMPCLHRPRRIVSALFGDRPLAVFQAAEEAALVTSWHTPGPRASTFTSTASRSQS